MNLLRTLSRTALLSLLGASLNGCVNAPDYDLTPAIDFKEIQVTRIPAAGGSLAVDEINFSLNFRDGDGDLGLSDDDIKVAPWNATKGGPNDRGFSFNYFIQPYRNVGGTWVKFVVPGSFEGEYNGRFLRLDPADAKPAPLKGQLNYKLPINLDGAIYRPGQVFRFEISIMDRALRQSNTITTSEVTL
ncbi:hypothetical protein [Hymenobacter terrenus]|uniref:hypothetical protein n=1 Tax=Hymenobacter terrenus TaxID=1629124 RepID=UPI000619D308|nr:hypothetical protein [Hymenobacter terrenus]